ncbi:eukaryotic mitochondrial regulator protein-domain-containing protein [Podospora conica]|nr:eukaryotic mitochondrial regulator protein-domain-containing protein [Schizothecium conicum]
MPPRLPAGCTSQLVHCLEPNALAIQHAVAGAGRPSRLTPATQHPSAPRQQSCFSTTTPLQLTKPQRQFRNWLLKRGSRYRDPPSDGEPRYMLHREEEMEGKWDEDVVHNRPFPANPEFRSQPVLSEKARDKIWESVMREGLPLKAVSARFSVDMRRVAAVVRMKEIENRWVKNGTPLAKPYARAVMLMLPKADLVDTEERFEPINDIHISSYTQQQLFVPVPESRHFTRVEAAKAFGDHIRPVDEKLRIPELLDFERDIAANADPVVARGKFVRKTAESEARLAASKRKEKQAKENKVIKACNSRFEFRFENINVDWSGAHGRDRRGVGWRYGAPYDDRRAGAVKIPTKVE